MKTMLRQLIPVVVVLAVPIIPFLFLGDLMEQWVSGLENSRYLPWIVIALLSGDLILPIPSSVITTYIGGQMNWAIGTLVSWVGMSLGAVIGFALARRYGPQFALRFSSAAQLENAGQLAGRFGPTFLVLARGVPVVAEASILLMGIHRLSWQRFLIPVLLSNLGISLGYTLFGAVAQRNHWLPLALGVSICVSIGLTLIAQHVLQSKENNFKSGLNKAEPRNNKMTEVTDSLQHLKSLMESSENSVWNIQTTAAGPSGALPLTDEMLKTWSSGDLFGMTQNAGMGWTAEELLGPQYLVLSTQGGVRADDGTPVALGYHTGHWEVGLLVQAAAKTIRADGGIPFAAHCSDPCDGRTQGTTGMFDSLPYRNDAAIVLRRLIRSLPTRRGVLGVATCDKGLPAMMVALAGMNNLPSIIVPGGVTLPPDDGEDAGQVQSIGARYVHGEITLEDAAVAGCRACATSGGGCQFLGTAATSQVVAEAMGMTLPHAALAPSGQAIWLEVATRSATAIQRLAERGLTTADILTDASIRNAMVVHAACGGSTNLLLHIPAIAHAAGLQRPSVQQWSEVNRQVPRFVDVLPNGPSNHPTIQFFLAGGVPEVMLHLRQANLLDTTVMTVSGCTLDEVLNWWEQSERRQVLRDRLREYDGIDPDDVIMSPTVAKERGLTSTVCFPTGNICPAGSVIKATSLDPSVVDDDGVYRKTGPARVFTSERTAIEAIKGQREPAIKAGDVLVLIGRGPLGSGMEETYQLTSALKFISWGKEVAIITDARFSGVSTGACIGHVGPEALAGGPIGKVRDGDRIRIIVDRNQLTGSIDLVGDESQELSELEVEQLLETRQVFPELGPDSDLPDDTRLWAALQNVGGGTWGGCVYDVDRILEVLQAGEQALRSGDAKGGD